VESVRDTMEVAGVELHRQAATTAVAETAEAGER